MNIDANTGLRSLPTILFLTLEWPISVLLLAVKSKKNQNIPSKSEKRVKIFIFFSNHVRHSEPHQMTNFEVYGVFSRACKAIFLFYSAIYS